MTQQTNENEVGEIALTAWSLSEERNACSLFAYAENNTPCVYVSLESAGENQARMPPLRLK